VWGRGGEGEMKSYWLVRKPSRRIATLPLSLSGARALKEPSGWGRRAVTLVPMVPSKYEFRFQPMDTEIVSRS
jgi:hypothetical protein